MAIAVISLIIYFISLEASHWPPFNSVITNHLAVVSGYICIVCIASVLLPSKVVKPYFYLSCPLIFAAIMVCWILKMRRGEQSVWRRRLNQRLSEKVWSLCRNGGCVLPR
nr:hypothetical protein Iba_chr15dCG1080 [Ipomoea batatas]